MPEQVEMQACTDEPVLVTYAGRRYEIKKDIRWDKPAYAPRWYAQRDDLAVTKRWYSRPEGAVTAILSGSAEWIK